MADWRKHLDSPAPETTPGRETLVVRRIPPAIWESVPALVVPSPIIHFTTGVSSWTTAIDVTHEARRTAAARWRRSSTCRTPSATRCSCSTRPTSRRRCCRRWRGATFCRRDEVAADSQDFRIAVVARDRQAPLFQSTSSFAPAFDATTDAAADLFQVRTQDFTQLVAEVRRFTTFTAMATPPAGSNTSIGRYVASEGRPLSIVIQQSATGPRGGPGATSTSATRMTTRPGAAAVARVGVASVRIARSGRRRRPPPQPGRQLQHPRRARRQHGPARADDEAGAAAGAAADGVRGDGVARAAHAARGDPFGRRQPRRRRRRRRAAHQALRRADADRRAAADARWSSRSSSSPASSRASAGFALRAGADRPADRRHSCASSAPLIERRRDRGRARHPPADLPPVLGDEPALRRVFQNLVDNAIKYGALRRLDRHLGARSRAATCS